MSSRTINDSTDKLYFACTLTVFAVQVIVYLDSINCHDDNFCGLKQQALYHASVAGVLPLILRHPS